MFVGIGVRGIQPQPQRVAAAQAEHGSPHAKATDLAGHVEVGHHRGVRAVDVRRGDAAGVVHDALQIGGVLRAHADVIVLARGDGRGQLVRAIAADDNGVAAIGQGDALATRQPAHRAADLGRDPELRAVLGELGDARAIPDLKACLETKIWDLKYAALMALEKLGDTSGCEIAANDPDWIIRARAAYTAAHHQ